MKKYIIRFVDEYFLRETENEFEALIDLEQATLYDNKLDAIKAKEKIAHQDFCDIIPYNSVLSEFLDWKKNGMIKRTIGKINESVSREYAGEDFDEVIKFLIYRHNNPEKIASKHYRTWPSHLKTFKKFIRSISFRKEIYQEHKDYEITFEISVPRDSFDFKEFEKEIEEVKKYVTLKDGDFFIFHIFDHELSQFESRYFYYDDKKKYCKIIGEYKRELFTGNLEKCFDVIRKDYYYEY